MKACDGDILSGIWCIFSVLGRKNDDEEKDGLFTILCSDRSYAINSFGHNRGNILTATAIICLIDDRSYCNKLLHYRKDPNSYKNYNNGYMRLILLQQYASRRNISELS